MKATPTGSRLGIDFGTTHTVAVLETPDGRAQPLLFDSSPLLSSAVYAEPGGRMLTGRDGERSARLDPTRYEPNPKRRIDESAVLLGNQEHPITRIIAAVLARVATEAFRAGGGPPVQTVLTYPANWGSRRKDILAGAASEAGLGPVVLVPEPVAAAAHFTGVLGRAVNPGEALAVYDFGAGTFDASVLRRRIDGAWELAACEGESDLGGLDLDAVLVRHIGNAVGGHHPGLWQRLMNPATGGDRRAARTLWDDVRAAKEQLSRSSSAAVHLPLFDTDTHLTREEFEAAARPLLVRTVEVLAALLRRLGPIPLAGLYLVGGSSRIPLVATLLHQRLGVTPTLIDQPELVVAQGSLRAVAAPGGAHGAGVQGYGSQGSGAQGSGAQGFGGMPVSGPPFGAQPTGANQVSAPPFGAQPTGANQVSAPPFGAQPTGGQPVSGPPFGAPPASVPGVPLWAGTPAAPPARPATRRRPAARRWIYAAAAVVLALAAFAGVQEYRERSADTNRTGDDSRAGEPGEGNGGADAPKLQTGPGGRQQLNVDRTVWYGGMKIVLGQATYDPAAEWPISVEISMENLGKRDHRNARSTDVYFAADGQITDGRIEEIDSLPSAATSKGKAVFKPTRPVKDLRAGVLSIGASDTVQAVVPLGDPARTVAHEPKQVAGPTGELAVGVLVFTFASCQQRADYPSEFKQADKDSYFVYCLFDVRSVKKSIYDHGVWKENFRLKLPDGTVVAATEIKPVLLDSGEQARDVEVGFSIRWPVPGAYTLQVHDAGRLGNEPQAPGNLAEVPMSLG